MADVGPAGRMDPLTCPGCRAPVPLGDGDHFPCPYCGADVELPVEYRILRDATAADAEARARAAEIFASVGRPPSALARLLIRSIGFLLLVSGVLIPVPVVLVTAFIHFGGTPFDLQLYDVLSEKQQAALTISSPFVAAAVGFLLIGAARKKAIAVGRIKAALAARPPPREGGRALCRSCGAALEHGPGDLGARCVYCGADNLLRMPAVWLERMKRYQAGLAPIHDAWRELEAERARHRRRLAWRSALAAPLLAIPILVLVRGCGPPSSLDPARATPDWQTAIASRLHQLPCRGGTIDLAPIMLAPGDCVEGGCVRRILLPLRKGERVLAVTGAPEEMRRANPLTTASLIRFDRHVMHWLGDDDPDRAAWGEEVARLRIREGAPGEFRAPTSGWFRATVVIDGATAGQWYSLCLEIRP